MRARIQRLRAELTSDHAAFESCASELEQLALSEHFDAGELARAAIALQLAVAAAR